MVGMRDEFTNGHGAKRSRFWRVAAPTPRTPPGRLATVGSATGKVCKSYLWDRTKHDTPELEVEACTIPLLAVL